MKMDLSLIPILLSFIFSIVISLHCLPSLFKARKDGSQSLKTPPGSTGLPFIGETLAFLSASRKGMLENFFLDKKKKYSSLVVKTSLFGEPVAVFFGPEANKVAFLNENKFLKAWKPPSLQRLFGDPGTGEAGLQYRKLFAPYFSPDALQRYVPIMDSGTKQHLQTYWEGKDIITVHPLAKIYTITIASILFLGIEDEETLTRLRKSFAQLMNGVISLPVNIPGTNFNRAFKAKAQLLKDLDAWVKKWKSDYLVGKLSASQSMLSHILKETFDEDDIAINVLVLIAAAHDSTSGALTCLIMFLGKFPHVYDKVLAEQRKIAASKAPKETLNWGDILKMKYSWNVARESLRLHSGIGTFKEVLSDFTYDGFLIPKGWKVHTTSATHMDANYFDDPEKFDPSRFEGDGPIPFSYAPFGLGPRMCPGMEYARIKILIFIHNLVTKFRWEQIFPHEKITADPMPRPAKGLPIRLHPHKSTVV